MAISRNVILAGRSCRALARDSVDYGITTRLWQEWCDVRAERPTLKRAVEDEMPQEKRPRPLDAPRSADITMGRRPVANTPIITTKRRTTAVDLQEEKKKVRLLEDEEMCDADEADEPHVLRRRGSRRKRTEETAPWKGELRRSPMIVMATWLTTPMTTASVTTYETLAIQEISENLRKDVTAKA